MSLRDVYIVEAKRSPVGRKGGVFRHLRPDDLLAQVIAGLMAAVPHFEPERLDDVIIGCAIPEAEQGMNVARRALRLAGLPVSVPGITINRFCASGLQAISDGALLIGAGRADAVLVGGVESMSVMPQSAGHVVKPNPRYFEDPALYPLSWSMGLTAERLAREYGIGREPQDLYALSSHVKAVEALRAGAFDAEIIPIQTVRRLPQASGRVDVKSSIVTTDEGPRDDTSIEKLNRLPPVFRREGSVTAGNSAPMSDGAAVLLLMSESALKSSGLEAKARFVDYQVAGVPPEVMGMGPSVAVPRLLKRVGWTAESLDWIELNEAFAVQALAVMQDLEWDPKRVNPLGGAIALGHPLGASGAIRAVTWVHAAAQGKSRRGLISLCVGMGMGVAGVLENVA